MKLHLIRIETDNELNNKTSRHDIKLMNSTKILNNMKNNPERLKHIPKHLKPCGSGKDQNKKRIKPKSD